MVQSAELQPGVTLYSIEEHRFKQGCLSIQLLRPMRREEAAKNALLPAVLLRGTEHYPDLRAITRRLDDLYGAAVSTMVRRIGDCQTTGLYCEFTEERLAMEGDAILAPLAEVLYDILRRPALEGTGFRADFTEGEKRDLIATIESDLNDKRHYALSRLLKTMCSSDSFGFPRLGEIPDVQSITAQSLFDHYRAILAESPVALFYVGSAPQAQIAELLRPLFSGIPRIPSPPPVTNPFRDREGTDTVEEMDIAQSQLCLGFTTPITARDPRFAAMQVFLTLFGSGMTSKLFMNVRERLGLCYNIGASYYSTKGIITVSAGIDAAKEQEAMDEILAQLRACKDGCISDDELSAAKAELITGLRMTCDSPAAIEGYYVTAALGGIEMTPEQYRAAVEAVSMDAAVAAARTVEAHSRFFLKEAAQ